MDYFSPIFGLVTSVDQGTENGGLFLAEYAVTNRSEFIKQLYIQKMEAARLPSGLYRRSANHNARSVSHDEITGMMAVSYIFNLNYHKEIWDQMVSHNGSYPAVIEDKLDYVAYNIGNYYPWCEYQHRSDCAGYLPFYLANMALSLSKDKQETSSKLIYWLELYTIRDSWINRSLKQTFESKMKEQYGDDWLMSMRRIYFNSEAEDFPLFKRQ